MLLKASVLADGKVLFDTGAVASSTSETTNKANEDASYDNNVAKSNKRRVEVNFIKLRPELVTDSNVYDMVQVSSILESPLASLYHNLHSLYAPLLLQNSAYSDKLPTKIQQLLAGNVPCDFAFLRSLYS